jgi:hypothetical protein
MLKILPVLAILSLSAFIINAQVAKRYDIVIDELLPDPSPQIGLPSSEFIELKNVSRDTFNLSGWKLSDGTSTATLSSFVLQPDSFVIICPVSSTSAFTGIYTALGVSNFPSLNNDGDLIYLQSPENIIIHAVNYSIGWFQNELKKDGGWSLEMIDTRNPCGAQANWKASINEKGGTPGYINSVDEINGDESGPILLRAYCNDSLNLRLVFNEPLDSLKGANSDNYLISDGAVRPLAAETIAPLFDKVNLKLNEALQQDKVYTVTASNLCDCSGNNLSSKNVIRFGWPSPADSFDVVVNEILFNPRPDGTDYTEIYNRSPKIIDAKHLFIANRNRTGVISNIVRLSEESRLFFPGDFLVIAEDITIVQQQYLTKDPDALLTVTHFPSFPNDKGDVIILNVQGNVLDEVKYDDKWNFKLLTNTEGVALERIDYNSPSEENNFHSAATSAGYGTPGYKNSQYLTDHFKGEINLNPEIFSPDNDGFDDMLTISYSFPSTGYVANITIFDAAGRPVRYLQRNALCGITGTYRWDGLGAKQQQLQQGIYIVYTEIFNTRGNKKQFKNAVVLARK